MKLCKLKVQVSLYFARTQFQIWSLEGTRRKKESLLSKEQLQPQVPKLSEEEGKISICVHGHNAHVHHVCQSKLSV